MKAGDLPAGLALPADGAPLLRAEGLTVTAGAGGPAVLRDVGLELARGRVLGLVGESGAGKSMLGRVVSRQLPAGFAVAAGSLSFLGRDLLALPAAEHQGLLGRRIAFIPQEPMTALNPVHTIGRQFAGHLARLGVPAGERAARAEAMLAEVRLPRPRAVMDSYPFQLSGGMCQRVMIAMAFAGDPELVVSDEATTALDASTQAHIVTLLRGLQARRGTGVLFVTHDLGLAARVCDDVAVLYAGTMCETGPAAAVFAAPAHPYTRALLAADPRRAEPGRPLAALPGAMPDVAGFGALAGCRFAPRCPAAAAACADAPPPLRGAGAARWRCLREPAEIDAAPLRAAGADGPATDTASLGGEPFLVVSGLGRTYPGRRGWLRPAAPVQAVEDVGFTVAPGEFIGVVGESGSGKSTLGRLVMGLEPADRGSVVLNGRPLGEGDAEWQRRIRAIQMVFQDPRSALNPRRRVRSLITQAMESRAHLRVERERRARELAADVGLAADILDRFPAQMSGGQRQRVNIGRSLCDVPQLLVADEIVSGLDVSVQAQVLNLLLELRRTHKISLLLISHDLGVVAHLCSRVLVMHRGAVVESGPTAQVFGSPAHPYTRSLLDAVPPADLRIPWPR